VACKRTPKSFGLSKIRAKSLKIRKNLVKIYENVRKIPENLRKQHENTGKKGAQRFFPKIGAHHVQNHMKTFLWRSSLNKVS